MSISFDNLPNSIPGGDFPLIPKGKYKATIEKAEMKQPKDEQRPPYLSLVWNVFDENGKSLGKLFDNLTESDSDYVRFKIRSFIEAIDVNLGKTFELRDLTKVSVGKTCIISITIDDRGNQPKNQINIFDNPPYARVLEAKKNDFIQDDDIPFDTAEAEPSSANSKESY